MNFEHSTSNIEHRMKKQNAALERLLSIQRWMFNVQVSELAETPCSMFVLTFCLLAPFSSHFIFINYV